MEAYQEINLLKSPALRQLLAFLRQQPQEWADRVPDLETFERDLHTYVLALEREVLAGELARYDVEAEEITVKGVVCRPAP